MKTNFFLQKVLNIDFKAASELSGIQELELIDELEAAFMQHIKEGGHCHVGHWAVSDNGYVAFTVSL